MDELKTCSRAGKDVSAGIPRPWLELSEASRHLRSNKIGLEERVVSSLSPNLRRSLLIEQETSA